MSPFHFILLASIMTGYQATINRCYKYGSSDKQLCFFSEGQDQVFSDLRSAQTYCHGGSGYLLEVPNELVYNITKHFREDYKSSFQNLRLILNLERFVGSSWTWINGEPVEQKIRNENKNKDSNKPLQYGVLMKQNSGFSLNAEESTVSYPYICSFNECLSGQIRSGSICLQAFSKTKDRWGARNECLKKKGDLGTLKDLYAFTYTDILTFGATLSDEKYWIGMQREVWTWKSSGKALGFSKWAMNNPQPQYEGGNVIAYLDLDFLFANGNPLQSYGAICLRGTPDMEFFNDPFPATTETPETYDTIFTESTSSNKGIIIGVAVALSGLVIIIIVTTVIVFLLVKRKKILWPRQNPFRRMHEISDREIIHSINNQINNGITSIDNTYQGLPTHTGITVNQGHM